MCHHGNVRRYDDCQFRRTGTDDGESDSQHTEEYEGNGMRTQNLAKFEERRYSPRDSPLRLDYIDNRRKRRERTDSYSGGKRQRGGSNTAWSASSTGSSYGGEPDREKLKRSHDMPYSWQYQKVDAVSWNDGEVSGKKKKIPRG